MGKKKKAQEHEHPENIDCVPCKLEAVRARWDQTLDAYHDLQPHLQHYAGMEAYLRLREGKMWFDELGGAAHEQNIPHKCRPATTPTA